MPSRTSLSLNLKRTQSPSVRGSGGKGLAIGRFRFPKLPDEVNHFNILEFNADNVAGGVEQFQFALVDEIRRCHVPVNGVAIDFADNDFLVSGGHEINAQIAAKSGFSTRVNQILSFSTLKTGSIPLVVAKLTTFVVLSLVRQRHLPGYKYRG